MVSQIAGRRNHPSGFHDRKRTGKRGVTGHSLDSRSDDSTYFTDDRYRRYRQPDNIKIPFWLKPVKYYAGRGMVSEGAYDPEKLGRKTHHTKPGEMSLGINSFHQRLDRQDLLTAFQYHINTI